MTFIDNAAPAGQFAIDPNRNDSVGLGLSVVLPLCALVVVQLLATSLGLEHDALHVPVFPFVLPAAVAAMVPILLMPLWGMARWACWQAGAKGRDASWWLVGLMAVMLAYPFLGLVLDSFLMNWLDVAVVILAAATAMRVGPVSRPALVCMLPSLVILTLAAIPGYVLLTGGWSPGLAITVGLTHPER